MFVKMILNYHKKYNFSTKLNAAADFFFFKGYLNIFFPLSQKWCHHNLLYKAMSNLKTKIKCIQKLWKKKFYHYMCTYIWWSFNATESDSNNCFENITFMKNKPSLHIWCTFLFFCFSPIWMILKQENAFLQEMKVVTLQKKYQTSVSRLCKFFWQWSLPS